MTESSFATSEKCTWGERLFLVWFIIMLIGVLASLIYFMIAIETKSKNKSSFGNPDYQKELSLFKNLKRQEQEEYLGLSRDLKIAKYGNRLI